MAATTIHASIDLDAPGKQVGRLLLPHSADDDAWGSISIPIASLRKGKGPCVLVLGGVHGDEYEGPIAIADLMRMLKPEDVTGQIILLPIANEPALRVARRNSGLDGMNLARAFPGDHRGQPTERIAAYITDHLFSRATHLIDLHAGGKSLFILPSAQVLFTPRANAKQRQAMLAMAEASCLPSTVMSEGEGDTGTSVGTAVNRGILAMAAELGQGGYATSESVAMTEDALMRMLVHIGVVGPAGPPGAMGARMRMSGPAAHLVAPADGWFERAFDLGESVIAGQHAGRLHDLLRPLDAPQSLSFSQSGIVYSHIAAGRVRAGMNLATLITPDTGTTKKLRARR